MKGEITSATVVGAATTVRSDTVPRAIERAVALAWVARVSRSSATGRNARPAAVSESPRAERSKRAKPRSCLESPDLPAQGWLGDVDHGGRAVGVPFADGEEVAQQAKIH